MCYRSLTLMILACAILSCANGCSEPETRFPVAGTVLIDGRPLTSGSIQFVPAGGRPVGGKISDDGTFRLVNRSVSNDTTKPGVAKGTYAIAISSLVIVDEDEGKIHRNIPKHYADFRTSGLTREITKAEKNLVIELTWEGAEKNEDSQETTDDSSDADTTDTAAEDSAAEQPVQEAEAAQEE